MLHWAVVVSKFIGAHLHLGAKFTCGPPRCEDVASGLTVLMVSVADGRWLRDEVLGRSDCTALIDPAVWAKRNLS